MKDSHTLKLAFGAKLPQGELPTQLQPSEYYKIAQKFEGRPGFRIGVRADGFGQTEPEILLYLYSMLSNECPYVKPLLIAPNLLYLEQSMEGDFESEALQAKIVHFLAGVSARVTHFARMQMDLLPMPGKDSDGILTSFNESIEQIKRDYDFIFA